MSQQVTMLKALGRQPILYVGSIGTRVMYEDAPLAIPSKARLYKYGISDFVYRRIAYAHVKTFKEFDVRLLRVTPKNQVLERMLTEKLKQEGLHMKLPIGGRTQRELFFLEDRESHYVWFEKLVDNLVRELDCKAMCF